MQEGRTAAVEGTAKIRGGIIGYGGVACHVLFEWDKRHDEFDLAILEKAWNQLIARHDMLRMVVDADGQQRILATTPEYHIPRDDLRALSPQEQRQALEVAAERVRSYHEKQKQDSWRYTEADGTVLGQKVTPLDRAGLYVPGGKASYPSSVLMKS